VAYDAAGNTNAGTVSGIVALSNAPATPAGLNVTTFSSSELYIHGVVPQEQQGIHYIEVIHLMEFMIFLLTPNFTATSWFDTNLIENTVYFYKITSV
jgi:hypothetical protein